jgi:hypothetical protein
MRISLAKKSRLKANKLRAASDPGLFSSLDLKLMRGFASPGSAVRGECDFG